MSINTRMSTFKKITEENVRRYLKYVDEYDEQLCAYVEECQVDKKEELRAAAAETLVKINYSWEVMTGFVMRIEDSHHARKMLTVWLDDPRNEREASDFLCRLRNEPRQLSSLRYELDSEEPLDTKVLAEIHYRLYEEMGVNPFTVEETVAHLESEEGISQEIFKRILLKHALSCIVKLKGGD